MSQLLRRSESKSELTAVVGLGALLDAAMASDDTVKIEKHAAVRLLRILYDLDDVYGIDMTSVTTFAATAHARNGDHGYDIAGLAAPAQTLLYTWIQRLREQFPRGADRSPHPRVQIRGGGPVGLAAALHARKSGAETVNVVGRGSRYYRQHMVSTFKTRQIGAANNDGNVALAQVTPEGMEELFDVLGVGLPALVAGAESAHLAEVANAVKWEVMPGMGRKVQICELEKFLWIVARVFGVTFASDAQTPAVDDSRAKVRDLAAKDKATVVFPLAAACAARDVAGAAHPNEANYDVLVGAEGPGSPTRAHYFPTAHFVTPRCWVNGGPGGAVPWALPPVPVAAVPIPVGPGGAFPGPVSDHLRFHGGLVTAGYVIKDENGACAAIATQVQFAAAIAPAAAGAVPDTGFRPHLFLKTLTPTAGAVQTRCQLELTFKETAALHLKRAFGSSCGFNYNLLSGTVAEDKLNREGLNDNPTRKQLIVMREIFKRAFNNIGSPAVPAVAAAGPNTAARDAALAAFKHVTEFKFWENSLKMSVADGEQDSYRPLPLLGKVNKRGSGNARFVVAVIGDAVRDALPDSGMDCTTLLRALRGPTASPSAKPRGFLSRPTAVQARGCQAGAVGLEGSAAVPRPHTECPGQQTPAQALSLSLLAGRAEIFAGAAFSRRRRAWQRGLRESAVETRVCVIMAAIRRNRTCLIGNCGN